VIAQCLQQDQRKAAFEFNTLSQQQNDECEMADTDLDVSFCTCSADQSEVTAEFVQTDTTRIWVNSIEQSVPCYEEPSVSELASAPELENAPENEIPDEFSVAECSRRPDAFTLQGVSTFAEEIAAPEIPELMPENVEEPTEIVMCLETAELLGKSITVSVEQLLETDEESAQDSVEEIPAAEEVEGCEVPSEVLQAESLEKMASETVVQNWSLESDDVDDFFEMAYEGKLSTEEIPSETAVLEDRIQPECSSSDQSSPDVFDGSTEEISVLETEDAITPLEILSDTVDLESKMLESSYTSDQILTVIDEEGQVKELEAESEEVTMAPDEVSSEFVVVEITGVKVVNTAQVEAPAEEDHSTEVVPEDESVSATCDEIPDESVQPSCMAASFVSCISSGMTEDNEPDEYADVAAIDEENVAEPEEISDSLTHTSVTPRAENLTTEVIDKSSCDDENIADEPDVETAELPEATVLESPLVLDEMVKVCMQSYSSEQTDVVQEDSLGDTVDELYTHSIEGETIENQSTEAGNRRNLLESCVGIVMEDHLEDKFSDLPDDISRTSFVSEATEDADTGIVQLPITVVSYDEFDSAGYSAKIHQQALEQHLTPTEEGSSSEIEDTATTEEAVMGEVQVDLETAETAPDLEVYEMYVEEEVTIEEKITESILTTVYSEEHSSVQEEGATVTLEGTECRRVLAWCDQWHAVRRFDYLL